MFFNRRRDNAPTPPPAVTADASTEAAEAREAIFAALSNRLGNDYGDAIREDFQLHVQADPVHGVEFGYACLMSKLIDFMDALHELADEADATPEPQPVMSPFSIYRKETS